MKSKIQNPKSKMGRGSALVLVVVLSVLLAMIGTLFILRSSVDSVGTRSVSDNKELQYAVDTVVGQLDRELVMDVPGTLLGTRLDSLGVSHNVVAEYQDYPWDNGVNDNTDPATNAQWKQDDRWLASLEPYEFAPNNYKWGHISDLYGNMKAANTNNVLLDPTITDPCNKRCPIVVDGKAIDPCATDPAVPSQLADADGDGVADAIWVKAMADPGPDGVYLGSDDTPLMTSKGKQIYLAIRVVDCGGMINVNTGYTFDPKNLDSTQVDGTSVTQVDLFGLAARDALNTIAQLEQARKGSEPAYYSSTYTPGVAARLDNPDSAFRYAPFDIADELKLRFRYLLHENDVISRIELMWSKAWDGGAQTPADTVSGLAGGSQLWLARVGLDPADPLLDKYDYRHLTTTYNCDRLMAPDGSRMVNVNTAPVGDIYIALKTALHADTETDPVKKLSLMTQAAQMAANIVDFRDIHSVPGADDTVTAFAPADLASSLTPTVYGFDWPRLILSEIGCRSVDNFPNPPKIGYAVEVYSFDNCQDVSGWQIVVKDSTGTIEKVREPLAPAGTTMAIGEYRVIGWGDMSVFNASENVITAATNPPGFTISLGDVVSLERPDSTIPIPGSVTWDEKTVYADFSVFAAGGEQSIERNADQFQWIKHAWSIQPLGTMMTLNAANNASLAAADPILAETEDREDGTFHTIGDLGVVFAVDARKIGTDPMNPDSEATTRINWADPFFADIPKYLTTMVPSNYTIGNTKVFGRININTAPAFVLAQLPWVSDRQKMIPDPADPLNLIIPAPWLKTNLAEAIIAYRDKRAITLGPDYHDVAGPPKGRTTGTEWPPSGNQLREDPGFASVAELSHVITGRTANAALKEWGIDWYGTDLNPIDNITPLDLTGLPRVLVKFGSGGGVPNDFEERDVIFSRISNLATVRSDVFCAYILVRLGEDGPQRRYIAILDRSGVKSPTDKVRIRALQPVADPR
jgi:hypothetical protein